MYGYGYDYGYADYDTTVSVLGGLAAMMGVISIISLAVSVFMIITLWKIYKKAGKKGWEAIVPIYNIIVLLEIVELPMWYIALFFVPIANIYAMFKIYIELAHKFGKSTGFGVLTVFFSFICLPILAFGKNNVYNGNNSTSNVNNNNVQQPQFTPNNNTFVNPNVNASMQNNPINNQNIQQPFMFNQNINTEINPITAAETPQNIEPTVVGQPVSPMNGIVTEPQPMVQEPQMVMPTMVENSQPVINQPENTFKYETPAPVVNEQPIQPNMEQNIQQQPINPMPGVVTNIEPMQQNQNNFNQNM